MVLEIETSYLNNNFRLCMSSENGLHAKWFIIKKILLCVDEVKLIVIKMLNLLPMVELYSLLEHTLLYLKTNLVV